MEKRNVLENIYTTEFIKQKGVGGRLEGSHKAAKPKGD